MAAKALSISVCAQANKKGGINETYPVIAIHFHLFLGIVFIEEYPIINNKSVDNIVLKLPTCKGVKPIKDFFIRMYELPHTKDGELAY